MNTDSKPKSSYRFLTDAAMKAMREDGWTITKAPGHGRSNSWNIDKNGKECRVSIRTTRDRWIAYQPQDEGQKWKTLADVDYVCVSAFSYNEGLDDPVGVNVHLINADVVRDVFNQNYKSRIEGNHVVTDNFGMWICMDKIEGTQAAFVGSGFATAKNMIANYPLDGTYEAPETETKTAPASQPEPRVLSVSNILDDARAEISKLTGIQVEGISLDLHLKA